MPNTTTAEWLAGRVNPNTTTAEWLAGRVNREGRHELMAETLPDRFNIRAYANVQAELAIAVQRIRVKGYAPRHAASEDKR